MRDSIKHTTAVIVDFCFSNLCCKSANILLGLLFKKKLLTYYELPFDTFWVLMTVAK